MAGGASSGIRITAIVAWSDAASATACAWFPDEKAATPRDRSASASDEILLYAPRNLNAPPRWRFSALRYTRAPARESSVREVTTGVRWATPSSRRAAASTSPSEIGDTEGRLLRLDVAAEVHQRLDRLRHERRRLVGVSERVRPGPERSRRRRSQRVDLGLDDARVTVVEGAHDRDRPAVLARMAHEELRPRRHPTTCAQPVAPTALAAATLRSIAATSVGSRRSIATRSCCVIAA